MASTTPTPATPPAGAPAPAPTVVAPATPPIPEPPRPTLPTSWAQKILADPASIDINAVHTDVVNLFKLNSADLIPDADAETHHDLINAVPTVPVSAPAVIAKASSLHTIHIKQRMVTFNPTRTPSPLTLTGLPTRTSWNKSMVSWARWSRRIS